MLALPIAALALAFQGLTPPVHPAPTAVVATIDGAPLTAGEVDPYLWDWRSRAVIDELVNHRIVAAEASRKNVTATDAEVKAKMDEQLADIATRVPAGGSVESFVQAQLGGMSHLALVARSSVLVDKLAELEFKPETYVKVATMVFRTADDSTTSLGKAIKSADSAYAALQAGKPWNAVLRQYETNPTALERNGEIGWRAVPVFPEAIRTGLATLKPLGYTKPTQTPSGIQIFRLLARGGTATPGELAELRRQYLEGSRASLVARLRAAAKVEVK